jgi:Zn-finger protein
MKVAILGKNGLKVVDLNRRKAIRERCLNCAGWSHKEVANCFFKDCPLYPFRSGQGKQNAKARAKAIRKFCQWCMNGQHGDVSRCPSIDCSLFPYRRIKTDRSTEIKSLQKNSHIKPFNRDKVEVECLCIEEDIS